MAETWSLLYTSVAIKHVLLKSSEALAHAAVCHIGQHVIIITTSTIAKMPENAFSQRLRPPPRCPTWLKSIAVSAAAQTACCRLARLGMNGLLYVAAPI